VYGQIRLLSGTILQRSCDTGKEVVSSLRRLDGEPGGLVNHDEVGILEEHGVRAERSDAVVEG